MRDRNLIGTRDAERVSTIASTPGLLEMLGAHLSPHDDEAVISHALFMRRYLGDRAVVGQKIRLDDRVYRVVGVLPAGFEFSFGAGGFDVWTSLPPAQNVRMWQYRMLARMAPGVGIEAAETYVEATARRLKETIHPYEGPNGEDGGYRARVVSLRDQLFHDFRAGTILLLTAVGLVLLIVCANVANLLLSRAAAREKETAIRRALGATRLRLIRQWLTEAVVLTALGGAAGVLLSYWGVALLRAISPVELPAVAQIGVDARALIFALAVSAAACILFSAAPLLTIVRMTGSLRGPQRGRRTSDALVTAEVAFALMLLVGSGLLIESFARLKRIGTGVRTDHLLTMLVAPGRGTRSPPRVRLFSELQGKLSRLPGVIAVSSTDRLPVFRVGVDTRRAAIRSRSTAAPGIRMQRLDSRPTPVPWASTTSARWVFRSLQGANSCRLIQRTPRRSR